MHIHYIGLGKMGLNMVARLIENGHTVATYDPKPNARAKAHELGANVAHSIANLLADDTPRIVWLMVPHQAVGEVLEELTAHLVEGDTVIEGGNSPFRETIKRAAAHEARGIRFLDAGISGGPGGARGGACIMVGGRKEVYDECEKLFRDLAVERGYAYAGKSGAGHFVKMVHNGIEYGMMQALAEGFDLMRQSDFDLDLTQIARLYNHGSVIESKLVGWLHEGFLTYGEDLKDISGSASASGEGLWTVETAHEMNVSVSVIEDSLQAREKSQRQPSYQGQLISVMRNMFGGHSVSKK